MNTYTMARFDPEDSDLRPLEHRNVSAESEDDAYRMMGEPFDRTYWQIIGTDDRRVKL